MRKFQRLSIFNFKEGEKKNYQNGIPMIQFANKIILYPQVNVIKVAKMTNNLTTVS